MTPTYELKMKVGPTPDKVIPLSRAEMIIGREATSDIVIGDADVSRRHARLTLQGDNYIIEDLGSTNGTSVNGQRLSAPQMLNPGDQIKLGDQVELVYGIPGMVSEATVMAPSPETFIAQPPAVAPTTYVEEPSPAYVEPYPLVGETAQPKKSSRNTWLLVGAGCLALLCICVVAAVAVYLYTQYM